MALRAVGFDLDYTLAVPTRDRQTLLNEATEAVGAPSMSREAYLTAHEDNLTAETRAPIFETLLRESAGGKADATPADLATAYRERVSGSLVPIPGAERLLSELRRRYRIGLLTNGPVVAQRDKLSALGWVDAFDVALVTGELPAGKPDPGAFTALVERLGSTPGETAYVGDDAVCDVGGAADAGLVPVQVLFPDGPEPDPRAAARIERDELADRLPAVLEDL